MTLPSNSQILAEVLASDVNVKETAIGAAIAVRKDNYRQLVRFQNVSSFSMQSLLRACPRKYQIQCLESDLSEPQERTENLDFAFGHAVGAGVATFDETGDMQQAMWSAFLAWNIDLLAEFKPEPGKKDKKKSFWHALWAIQCYQTFRDDETDLLDYGVVKTEATIAIDFENGQFYVGHIDQLLRHRETGYLKVKENKTTAFSSIDPLLYENSDQALSYAVVVDMLGEAEYSVIYTVYSTSEQRWIAIEFNKSALDKVEWLRTQYMLQEHLESYTGANFFPKNGANCLSFGRRCEKYETCGFNLDRVFGKQLADLPWCESLEELNSIEPIDYAITLTQIKDRTKERLTAQDAKIIQHSSNSAGNMEPM